MKSYKFSFLRASDVGSYKESGLSSGLIEKVLKCIADDTCTRDFRKCGLTGRVVL